MGSSVEVAPIQRLLSPRERLVAVLVADNSYIPIDGLEDFEYLALCAVDDDLVHVLTCCDLYLALDNALDRSILFGSVDRWIGLNADDQIIADRPTFLKH